MASASIADKVSYQEFHEEWIAEVEDGEPSPLDKGRRFASNLITQWLDVTTDDDDFVICDGSGDGGIDVAYLKRADIDTERHDDNSEEGDTWYLVQSKYGTAFAGVDTILEEGSKVIATLMGQNQHLSQVSRQLLQKLDLFQQQASDADRIVLVFATTNPITQQDRQALDDIKLIGRERGIRNFGVEEVSLQTIWEALEPDEAQKLSVPVKGQFVEQYSGLLVGTVSLVDLFEFLKSYKSKTGDLTTLYEKNVRQFLGGRRKINKGIANTLNESPEKFGLYNNGITVVVSGYSKSLTEPDIITMNDPHVVNGCQTTRTIWDVLDSKLNSGGTGSDAASAAWRERASRGGVVTKIVRSDEAEITNITRFTNSQNSVREQDFIALHSGFQNWATAMASGYDIFLEIQRGGAQARRAYETQHPDQHQYSAFANAFELGSVDISPQPDESGGEVQEAQVSGVQLLKPGEDPAIVLDLVDEAFHQMTLPVQMPVIVGGCLAVRAGRNDRHHTQFQDVSAKLLGIVPFVGQYVLASITGDQLLRLGDVVLLPSGQDESQGVAQAVHAHVNLGAEPAAAPAQGLGRLATLFGGAPAAQGCARTTVLSMIRYSRSASSQKC